MIRGSNTGIFYGEIWTAFSIFPRDLSLLFGMCFRCGEEKEQKQMPSCVNEIIKSMNICNTEPRKTFKQMKFLMA